MSSAKMPIFQDFLDFGTFLGTLNLTTYIFIHHFSKHHIDSF